MTRVFRKPAKTLEPPTQPVQATSPPQVIKLFSAGRAITADPMVKLFVRANLKVWPPPPSQQKVIRSGSSRHSFPGKVPSFRRFTTPRSTYRRLSSAIKLYCFPFTRSLREPEEHVSCYFITFSSDPKPCVGPLKTFTPRKFPK